MQTAVALSASAASTNCDRCGQCGGTAVACAAGGYHSLLLMRDGAVLSFGDGASGQQAAALTAELRGAPGEEVEVAFLSPEGKVVTDKVTIGKDGTALARARAAEA